MVSLRWGITLYIREDDVSEPITKQAADVKLIVYACEAGMGSSLMGANQLKKMIKKAKLDIEVVHAPVQAMPAGADLILTHKGLAAQARVKAPEAAIISYQMFMNDPAVKGVVENLKNDQPIVSVV